MANGSDQETSGRPRGGALDRHDDFAQTRAFSDASVAVHDLHIIEHRGRGTWTPDRGEGWAPLGPDTVLGGQAATNNPAVSGRVNSIAIAGCPADGGRVYVATANGGVWRSDDDGASWVNTMQARPGRRGHPSERPFDEDPESYRADSLACGAVAVVAGASASQDTVYAGTGEPFGAVDSYFGVGPLVAPHGGDRWPEGDLQKGPWIREHAAKDSPTLDGKGFYQIAAVAGGPVFAATRAGLYRRSGSGGSWSKETLPSDPGNEPATSVVHDRAAGKTVVYAAVMNRGVYRWDSQGKAWELKQAGLPNDWLRLSLAVRAEAAGEWVYALTDEGRLYHLGPGGSDWSEVDGLPERSVKDGEGNVKKDQKGNPIPADWRLQGTYNLAIAVDPDRPTLVYVGMASTKASKTNGAEAQRRSVASGALYRIDLDKPVERCFYIGSSLHADIHALEFDGRGRLWVGCDGGVFRSPTKPSAAVAAGQPTPPGATTRDKLFEHRNHRLPTMTVYHFGQHPIDRHRLVCGCQDNGCIELKNGEWESVTDGDSGGALLSDTGAVLASVTMEKLTKRPAETGFFAKRSPGARPGDCLPYPPLVASPADASLVAFGAAVPYVSSDFGDTWAALPAAPGAAKGEKIVSLAFAGTSTLYAGTTHGRVLRYKNGVGWEFKGAAKKAGMSPRYVTDLAVDPADPNQQAIYLTLGQKEVQPGTAEGDYHRVYRCSFSNGGQWEARSGPPPTKLLELPNATADETEALDGGTIPERLKTKIGTIRPDPTGDWTRLEVPAGAGAHRVIERRRWYVHAKPTGGADRRLRLLKLERQDTGALEVSLDTERLLDIQHNAIAVDPVDHDTLYAAADIGVWRSIDAGGSWHHLSRGLPDAAVLDLKTFADGEDRLLRAATHGRGLFERPAVKDVVDVLCVVDASSWWRDRQSTGTSLDTLDTAAEAAKYCRIVTRDVDRAGENAEHDTVFQTQVGEMIRWRAVSLTADETYEVQIDDIRIPSLDTGQPAVVERPARFRKTEDLWKAQAVNAGTGPVDCILTLEIKSPTEQTPRKLEWPIKLEVNETAVAAGPDSASAHKNLTELVLDSEAVDILCVVDGKTLFDSHPEAKTTAVQLTTGNEIGKYCRMITRRKDALSFNAEHNLEIRAVKDDVIRWRAVSLTDDSEYKVDIQSFYSTDDTHLYTNPRQPDPTLDVWESTIVGTEGSDNYYLKFTVEHGGEQRWFDWDPVITVVDPTKKP